jgi:hypothetical protein
MKKKDKKGNKRNDAEDYYDIRKNMSKSKSFKSKRKKDKRYLSDMLGGNIDSEDYYDYNDIH